MRLALPLAVLATLQFTSSAVFAVPPGAQAWEYVGQALFS